MAKISPFNLGKIVVIIFLQVVVFQIFNGPAPTPEERLDQAIIAFDKSGIRENLAAGA